MRIGARTFKTGLAVCLALIIPGYFGLQEGAILAGLSAVASMQPSVRKSFHSLRDRLLSNTIGGMVAVFMASVFGNSYIMIGLSSALLIALLFQLKLKDVIVLSTMTLIIIMLAPQENLVFEATIRVLSTFIGVIVAFLINSFILPPKYDERLYQLTNQVTDDLTRFIRTCLRKNVQHAMMREDLNHVEKKIERMRTYLTLIQDIQLRKLFVKKSSSLARLIVVYRQFIRTTEAAHRLVITLHESEYVFNQFPEDLRILLRERLETLMAGHEQILLKWNGRVLPEEVNFIAYKSDLRKTFMDSFFNEASLESYMKNDYGQSNSVIHLMSAVLEYEESLQHLNTLVRSFKKHHNEESPVIGQFDDV